MSEESRRPVTETDAARYLAVSPSTLRRWRWVGKGPRYFRIGNVIRYRTSDLDQFVGAHSAAECGS